MKKKIILLSALGCAALYSAQDLSTIKNMADVYTNADFIGSSRFNAMAGSMGALGGDVSAAQTNPAAVGVMIQGDLSATLGILGYENTSNASGRSVSYKKSNTNLSNVSGSAVFMLRPESQWKFVNLGFNISNQNLDNYVETPGGDIRLKKNLIDPSNTPVVGNLMLNRHAYDRTGDISKMSFAVGANYNNEWYFGVGLNVESARINQSDIAEMQLDLNKSTATYQKQFTPYAEDASGINMSLGVIGRITKEFRIGASFITPTYYNIDRTYNYYTVNNNGYVNESTAAETRTLISPSKGMLSGAFVPNKNFSINLDYQFSLGKPNFKEHGVGAEEELNAFFKDKYIGSQDIRLGAEYRLNSFRIRGGYAASFQAFDGMSLATYTQSQKNYDQLFVGRRNTLGLGLGYDFKNMNIDIAYQNVSSTYQNPYLTGQDMGDYSSGYFSPDISFAGNSVAVSEVKNSQNRVFVTLGWKF